MYFETSLKSECRGCTACLTGCPKNAIEMNDIGGFLYPSINEDKCIHCGLCRVICEKTLEMVSGEVSKSVFYGWNQNNEIRWNSTSGGAFSAIVDTYLSIHPDAWIYGAVYGETFRVAHRGTQERNMISNMCRSKYLQSDIRGIYAEILAKLKGGSYVLFSGTPCQVAGLKALAESYTEKLFTVDFICHGVSNPDYFDRYLRALEKRENSNIVSYSFRNKIKSHFHPTYRSVRIAYQNGRILNTEEDLYIMSYKKRLFYRESCYSCNFASSARCSDITMGDFWGIEKEFPDLKKQRLPGLSMIMFNTDKSHYVERKMNIRFCMHRYTGDFSKYEYLFAPTPKPTITAPNMEGYDDFILYLRTIITPVERWKYLHPKATSKLQSLKRKASKLAHIKKRV